MTANPLAYSVRAKKLGVLIYDARLAARRSVQECAQAIGVSSERFQDYESGIQSPSLPEIEILAYFLNTPLDHFWSRFSLSENITEHGITDVEKLIRLRQRMIGATLNQVRMQANLSPKEVTERAGITEQELRSFEMGEQQVPLPILESIIQAINSHIDYFKDKHGPVAKWMNDQQSISDFAELPQELRDFICKPINRPYIELAARLSELSVDKLRAVAENILEITY
jgi:transcriptional regulator with XRE-family HTH domain